MLKKQMFFEKISKKVCGFKNKRYLCNPNSEGTHLRPSETDTD